MRAFPWLLRFCSLAAMALCVVAVVIAVRYWPAWADYDHDGDLDLFVGNEAFPCQLFQNDGTGHFTDVARQAGVTNDRFTKGCSWGDIDNRVARSFLADLAANPNIPRHQVGLVHQHR